MEPLGSRSRVSSGAEGQVKGAPKLELGDLRVLRRERQFCVSVFDLQRHTNSRPDEAHNTGAEGTEDGRSLLVLQVTFVLLQLLAAAELRGGEKASLEKHRSWYSYLSTHIAREIARPVLLSPHISICSKANLGRTTTLIRAHQPACRSRPLQRRYHP